MKIHCIIDCEANVDIEVKNRMSINAINNAAIKRIHIPCFQLSIGLTKILSNIGSDITQPVVTCYVNFTIDEIINLPTSLS